MFARVAHGANARDGVGIIILVDAVQVLVGACAGRENISCQLALPT